MCTICWMVISSFNIDYYLWTKINNLFSWTNKLKKCFYKLDKHVFKHAVIWQIKARINITTNSDITCIVSWFLLLTSGVYRVSLNAPRHVRRHKVNSWDSWLDKFSSFAARVCTGEPMSLLVVVRCAGSPVWSQLGWGKLLAKVASVVLWTSGTMSRQEKQKATRSFFTFRFRMKHRVRGSRRNCQGSSKTSTENCAGNIKRVSGFIGPPRSAKLAALWLAPK